MKKERQTERDRQRETDREIEGGRQIQKRERKGEATYRERATEGPTERDERGRDRDNGGTNRKRGIDWENKGTTQREGGTDMEKKRQTKKGDRLGERGSNRETRYKQGGQRTVERDR